MATGWTNTGILKTAGIPAPTGKYRVGCVHLIHDDLFMRLYYPTDSNQTTTTNYQYAKHAYDSKYNRTVLEFQEYKLAGILGTLVPPLINAKIPALLNAPINSEDEQYPVVVYSHGLGTSFFVYGGICADIASHGYVVAAVEHKDESACVALRRVPRQGVQEGRYDQYVNQWIPYLKRPKEDFPLRNRQVKQRSQEVRQALDILQLLQEGGDIHNMLGGSYDFSQFKGRVNTNLAAVAGHSFGGATTIQVLSEDKRFCCGIALDVWMFPLHDEIYAARIDQPLQFINSYSFQWKENVAKIMKLLKPVTETGIKTHRLYTIKGSNHTNQSDGPFVMPTSMDRNVTTTDIDPSTAHDVNMKLMHAFLLRVLHKDPNHQENVPLLDGGEGSSEHVLLGTNVDLTTQPENVSLEDTPKDTSKEPEDTPKEPEDTPKEPEDTSKEPSKEVEDTFKEPEDTPKEVEDTPKEPEDTSKEPSKEVEDTSKEPEDTPKEPSKEVEDTSKEPEDTPKEPEDTSKEETPKE